MLRFPLLIVGVILCLSSVVQANNVPTISVDDPLRCDILAAVPTRMEELGDLGFEPLEKISAFAVPDDRSTCFEFDDNPDITNWRVEIKNETTLNFTNLHFVADTGERFALANVDGTINGADAFKIDAAGVNEPLLDESIAMNDIFEPTETWTFLVVDFVLPLFGSLGVPSPGLGSTASIVAVSCAPPQNGPNLAQLPECPCNCIPIPEPTSSAVLVSGLASMLLFGAASIRSRAG
jgi:hypothetical protein